MNSEFSQVIAFTAHGNACLAGVETDLASHSTMQFVERLSFARYQSTQQEQGVPVAGSAAEWFAFLRAQGAQRLRVAAFAWERADLPEHHAAAFAGGVPLAIQADLPSAFELWYPLWQTGGPAGTPWRVTYRGLLFPMPQARSSADLGAERASLHRALLAAQAFAAHPEVSLPDWAGIFARALALLEAAEPVPLSIPLSIPDLLPARGYSAGARRLLAAASQAYVFGGMGSWNDLGFSASALQQEYEQVSQSLYEAVKSALVMAANSFDPAG